MATQPAFPVNSSLELGEIDVEVLQFERLCPPEVSRLKSQRHSSIGLPMLWNQSEKYVVSGGVVTEAHRDLRRWLFETLRILTFAPTETPASKIALIALSTRFGANNSYNSEYCPAIHFKFGGSEVVDYSWSSADAMLDLKRHGDRPRMKLSEDLLFLCERPLECKDIPVPEKATLYSFQEDARIPPYGRYLLDASLCKALNLSTDRSTPLAVLWSSIQKWMSCNKQHPYSSAIEALRREIYQRTVKSLPGCHASQKYSREAINKCRFVFLCATSLAFARCWHIRINQLRAWRIRDVYDMEAAEKNGIVALVQTDFWGSPTPMPYSDEQLSTMYLQFEYTLSDVETPQSAPLAPLQSDWPPIDMIGDDFVFCREDSNGTDG